MRCIATFALVGTVIVSTSAFAGEGALKPGLPAGVHQAQTDSTALLAVGGMVAAASLALIISSTSGGSTPAAAVVSPTTTS